MNKRVMITGAICMTMLFCSCGKKSNEIKPKYYNESNMVDKVQQLEKLELNKLSKDEKIEIAKYLFEKHIIDNRTDWKIVERENLKRDPVVTLTDYKINKVNFVEEKEDTFTVDIVFDIQYTNDNDGIMWIAGNGDFSDDNWVVNKCNFVDIEKVDNEYKITNIYTG